MLREDSRHGAMPLAVVREMSREYEDYLAQVEPSRAPVRAAHAAERAASYLQLPCGLESRSVHVVQE